MRSAILYRLIASLLCLTLLFKVVIPVGFMPDMEALGRGVLTITICSSVGAKEILVDQNLKEVDKSGPHNNQGKNHQDVCPFGAAPQTALTAAIFIFGLLSLFIFRYFLFAQHLPLRRCNYAAWPRGPPLL